MSELTISAQICNLETVIKFICCKLDEADCPARGKSQLILAAEEIFVNIANYAYCPGHGPATIGCEVIQEEPLRVILQFIDTGAPYNPLAKEDPDITLDASERDIGGLGILLVKKCMDSVDYVYRNGKNILTLKKNI